MKRPTVTIESSMVIQETANETVDYSQQVNGLIAKSKQGIEIDLCILQNYLPSECFKMGKGGNHIWIADHSNRRLAVIYYR